MRKVRVLVLGAGPTGIGAALRLQEAGVDDWLIIDREREAGGLACSVLDENGFTWDMGSHVQFSHYDSFDRYMDLALGPEGWLHHQRESWVWIAERFVPYPFQNNLHRLPPTLRWDCVKGLLHASAVSESQGRPRDFQQWIDNTFGSGIAELFLNPYNFKVWACRPGAMTATWVGERVAVPPIERVLKAVCLEEDDVSWGPNNTFRFPRHGGTGAIWRSLALRLPAERLLLNTTVKSLDASRHRMTLSSGEIVEYGQLISTLPLDRLAMFIGGQRLVGAAKALRYSSTHVIGIGLKGQPAEHLMTKCWMYFPEANCPFYRVTVFSNLSPNNVPNPGTQWSLMAEVSESPYKSVDATRVVEDTIGGMLACHLFESRDEIVATWHRRLEYGYPTPGTGRDEALSILLPAMEQLDIFSRGRFGAWKYEVSNQDHSFAQGREVVDRLLGTVGGDGSREPTLNHSDLVNGRRNP